LQVVLDSNEYLFAFGGERKDACRTLLRKIAIGSLAVEVRISRTILREVERNASAEAFKDLWIVLEELGVVPDEDWQVPFELGLKYERMGLKDGDAFIAAYTEWTGAHYLISENRDFLTLKPIPFEVLKAEKFLKRHS